MDKNNVIPVLLLLTILVFILNINCLSLIMDDWAQLSTFESISTSGNAHALKSIFTNDWISGDFRIFFVSYWLKYFIYKVFGTLYLPYILFNIIVHFGIAVLLFKIMSAFDETIAAASAFFYLVLPSSHNTLFWNNNIFFMVPVFFYLLYIYVVMKPRKSIINDYFSLIAIFVLGQFSGEQMLLVFYGTPIVALYLLPYRSRIKTANDYTRIILPFLVGVLLMILYIHYGCSRNFRLVTGHSHFTFPKDAHAYTPILLNTLRGISDLFYYKSWYFGNFSIKPSWRTLITCLYASIVLAAGICYHSPRGRERRVFTRRKEYALLTVLMLLYSALVWAPMAYFVGIGIRIVEPRYFYEFGIPISVLMGICATLIFRRCEFLQNMIVFLIFSYLAFITCYALNENWRYNKSYDQAVWAATTDQMKKGYNHILFVGARRHWCNAMSDFMQTWGISGYLTMHGGKEITSDIDTLTDKNKDRKTVVIKVECPSLTDTVNPHITIFPSYESYVRSTGK